MNNQSSLQNHIDLLKSTITPKRKPQYYHSRLAMREFGHKLDLGIAFLFGALLIAMVFAAYQYNFYNNHTVIRAEKEAIYQMYIYDQDGQLREIKMQNMIDPSKLQEA